MGLFDSIASGFGNIFGGVAKSASTLFKTPIPGGGSLGGALLAPVAGAGLARLTAALGPSPQRQVVQVPGGNAVRGVALPPGTNNPAGLFAPQGSGPSPGRTFTTPGDFGGAGGFQMAAGFLPGVVGSQGLSFAAPALGAAVGGAGRILGGLIRSPVVQGAGGALAVDALLDENGGMASTPLFRATNAGARANSVVLAINPVTGSPTFFRHVGKPMLFTGDIGIAKRVDKVARRARRKR